MSEKAGSAEMAAVAQAIRANRDSVGEQSVQQQRDAMEKQQAALSIPEGCDITDETIAEVPCRWFIEEGDSNAPVLVYYHGGGYIIGSLDSYSELCARLALTCKVRVLSVGYRLAPEHPYPAGLDDSVAVTRELIQREADARSVIVGGDSAGGGMALAVMLRLKADGSSLPRAALLFSPWTDLTSSGESYASRAQLDPMIEAPRIKAMAALYAGDTPLNNELVSPLLADHEGLPPLLIQVGDCEVLLSDSADLADRSGRSGVESTLEIYPGAFHVFQAVPGLPESDVALASAASFVSRFSG